MKFFFGRHKKFIIFIIILLIGGAVGAKYFLVDEKINYVTSKVKKGDIINTVSVTGSIVSDIITDLHFEINGKLEKINFNVGDSVNNGDIIAELSANDEKIQVQEAEASLNAAQANLNLKRAGATLEDIRVAETNVASAEVALKIAKTNLTNTEASGAEDIRKAELDLQNSELSLLSSQIDMDNSEISLSNIVEQNQQSVDSAYEALKVTMEKNLLKIYDYLIDMDEILGVDDEDVNDSFESSLGILKSTSLERAQTAYRIAKNNYIVVDEEFIGLEENSSSEKIKSVADDIDSALRLIDTALLKTRVLLNNSVVSSNLTSTMLSAFKSTIDTGRTGINTEASNLQTKKQALNSAEISQKYNIDTAQAVYDIAKSNYEKAQKSKEISEHNLSTTKIDVENFINSAELEIELKTKALETAKASYNFKKAPPRKVDVASLEAQVVQAQAALSLAKKNLEKTKLKAPSNGIIININGELGENISISTNFAVMISQQLIIEADVSETDISKIKISQPVNITFDAFGDDKKFLGDLFFIDPAETRIQDVIYYKIKIALNDRHGKSIRSGMTANIDILAESRKDALFIPQRTIIEKDGNKIVKILKNGDVRETRVATGIRGDGGVIEIISGLMEGQDVVVSIKK
ncbi:MAG: efflux RND transporter periplasmic adaptor subunit [Patescibacteria group bacterium]|nr:efflux RND transporter periplasmic adaptor subunit [Patescibacteria group bacterium]